MKRRFSTRDAGLSIRMGVALAVVGLLYLALEAFLVLFAVMAARDRDVVPAAGLVLFAIGVPLLLRKQYRGAARVTLRALHARPEASGDLLVPVAAKLAALADVAAPDIVVADSRAANALAVPTQGKSLIVVTTERLRVLEPEEIEAVLAHEITHLANGDGKAMTFVGGPALAGSAMWHAGDARGKIAFASFYWPFWLLGLLLMRAVSRYREYTSDRGSALLTGAPEQLMSALTKLSGAKARGDLRGGSAVSTLCVVESRHRRALLADHPPLAKRLARLAEMAREQGQPVGA
jgi:heat shock protein HtpX